MLNKNIQKNFQQREQTYIHRNIKSYSPRMTDLLTSNFSDIANISSKNTVSNTKQSSSLVPTRTTFNSNGNRNSNCNNNNNSNSKNQHVQVRDDSINETDQSNKKPDITSGQGIGGKKKRKLFHYLIMILNKIIPLPCQLQKNVSIITITTVMMTSLIRNSLPISFIPVTISIAIAITIAIVLKKC